MIKHFIEQWYNNKHELESFLDLEYDQSEDKKYWGMAYEQLFQKVFELVVTEPREIRTPFDQRWNNYSWDWDRFQVINHGDYQGEMIFIMVPDVYQPTLGRDYYFTAVTYGSCSSCDTMQWVEYELKTKDEKIQALMNAALHIVQSTKTFESYVVERDMRIKVLEGSCGFDPDDIDNEVERRLAEE